MSDSVVFADRSLPKRRVGCSEFYPIMMSMLVEKFDERAKMLIRPKSVKHGYREVGENDDGEDRILHLKTRGKRRSDVGNGLDRRKRMGRYRIWQGRY